MMTKPLDENDRARLRILAFPPDADCDEIVANDARPLPYRIMMAAELWEPLPPPDYLVEKVLVRANLAMLAAIGASSKTWAAIDLGIAIATGGKWLGRFPCKAGRVLVVDWESGSYELRRRLQAVGKARGEVGPVENINAICMPVLWLNAEDFADHLRELATDRALIIFDSLAAGSGGQDENDARFAAPLNLMKTIGEETGCTFLVLHHSRKGSIGGETGDARERPRGTSALFSACDVVLQIEKGKDDLMVCTQTKSRCGPKVPSFVVRVDDLPGGAIRVEATDVDAAEVAEHVAPLDRVKAQILRVLGQGPQPTREAIYRRIPKGKKSTKVEALNELVELDLVVEAGKSWRLASEEWELP